MTGDSILCRAVRGNGAAVAGVKTYIEATTLLSRVRMHRRAVGLSALSTSGRFAISHSRDRSRSTDIPQGGIHAVHAQDHCIAERCRSAARPCYSASHRDQSFRQRPPAAAALPGGPRAGGVRARLLLGRRAQILGARRRHLHHRRRLRRWPYRQPDLRRGLFGPHRPYRSGAGGVRSEARSPTSNC